MTKEDIDAATEAYNNLKALQVYRASVDAETDGPMWANLAAIDPAVSSDVKTAVLAQLDTAIADAQAAFDAM